MKNKTLLSVLSLGVITGVLASCGNAQIERLEKKPIRVTLADGSTLTANPGEPEVKKEEDGEVIKINDPSDPAIAGKLTSLSAVKPNVSLFFDKTAKNYETHQIEVDFTPYTADISNLQYTSSNEEVATVSNTGLVTAVGEGVAEISVKSADGTLGTNVHVVCNNSRIPASYATNRRDEINANQSKPDFEHPEAIYLETNYDSKRVNMNEGKVLSRNMFSERFWISKTKNYFRIVEDDYEIKVSGGSLVPGHVDYIFYTTDEFFSYAFKTASYSKNYMRIDQSSLIPTGDPFNGLLEVLDNFFTSGKAIVENQLDAAYGQDLIKDSKTWKGIKSAGRFTDDTSQLAIYADVTASYQVGPDQEEDFDIPAYTPFTVNDKTRALWENNLLSYKEIDETWEWELDGVTYQDQTQVHYVFKTKDVELPRPDLTQYNQVTSIFDL